MLTLLFILLMFVVFGKIAWWGLKATWGLTKLLIGIVFLPIILIMIFLSGALIIAFPVLVILGLIALVVPLLE